MHHEKSKVFSEKEENKNQLENAKTFLILYGKNYRATDFVLAQENHVTISTAQLPDSFQNVYLMFTPAFESKLTFVTNASPATLICVKLFPLVQLVWFARQFNRRADFH